MSMQYETATMLLSDVKAPAERELDLGIRAIDDATMACPYGSVEMNVRAVRDVRVACPYGSVEMNLRTVRDVRVVAR